jgi:OFA family oxalate/formate antiporter-like MFS transporter
MNLSRKHLILFSAVTMQFFLGANYAWSIFAQELKIHYGFSMTQCQAVFSTLQLTFTIVFLIGGRLLDRYGPRIIGSIGGIIFGIGYFLAGVFNITFASLIVFIGVMGGLGMGFAYLCPISTAQKWFPDKKPLVSGIAVAGFGFGPLFIAMAAEFFLKHQIPINDIFKIFGITFFLIITGAALSLKLPDNYSEQKAPDVKIKSIIFSRMFWSLFIPLFSGLFAGLMVISNLKPMGIKWLIPEFQAAIGVSILALFNGTGRFSWGYIAQRIGENKSIKVSLLLQAATLLLSVLLVRNTAIYLIFAAFVGFNYGASLVLYVSYVSKVFGVQRLGSIYPVLFISNALSGVLSPTLAGWIFDKTGSYNPALICSGIICLAGFVAFSLLNEDTTNQ